MDNLKSPKEQLTEEEKRERQRIAHAHREAIIDSTLSREEFRAKEERRKKWREARDRRLAAEEAKQERISKAEQAKAAKEAEITFATATQKDPAAVPQQPVGKTVERAKLHSRHWGLLVAFLIITVLPSATTFWYLYTRAADQYASTLAFTVRSDETTSATDLLGGLGKTLGGGSAARDTDILNEFIVSQEIVRSINKDIDLETIYSKKIDQDPILGYHPGGPIENLESYWRRMVRVSHDSSSGLMELRALAFTPEDAMAIANAINDESSKMINQLSQTAREDATRYAEEDLAAAVERLKSARDALTSYRLANQIVDPNADIQVQMGLLTTLQTQQASALIEYDLISENGNVNDPRVEQARRRLEVIESRIAEERRKFGVGGGVDGGVEYATTISEFERLTVDREFAQAAYAATLQALDGARADANRKSRYLAAYIKPTIAEKSQFPQRNLIMFIVTGFAFLIWAILSLVYYALRDRN
jgi:capsular polysaccharide transport system permease protein